MPGALMPTAARPRTRRRLLALAALGLASSLACTEIFGPSQALPEMARMHVTTNLRHGGLLFMEALPADTAYRLPSGRRVPVDVHVSSGDREVLQLFRLRCPPRESGTFNCFKFWFVMDEGHHAHEVAGHVAAIGGRFESISISGVMGSVVLFSPEGLVRQARAARSWPGVWRTNLSFLECQSWAPAECGSRAWLAAPMPVDTGAAIPGDGILQVRPGDTVRLVYTQPSGGVLEYTLQVP
jgi:hypothetical protein